MKTLHPNFKVKKIRGDFSFSNKNYTFYSTPSIETLFNGAGVSCSQCTSMPGERNGHLQLGLVGTSNMDWIRVFDKEGKQVLGLAVRPTLDGGLVIGPRYEYNHATGEELSQEELQEFANMYLKHIGIEGKVTVPTDLKSIDPDISELGGVKSYHESGEIKYRRDITP